VKTRKPLAPRLPGVYGKMTREEFDALSDSFDKEFSLVEAKPVPNDRPHPKRNRGRPKKAARSKAPRVLMTIEPELLAKTDAAARAAGATRAGFVQDVLREWLSRKPNRARAA
jgi:hypothetical protein